MAGRFPYSLAGLLCLAASISFVTCVWLAVAPTAQATHTGRLWSGTWEWSTGGQVKPSMRLEWVTNEAGQEAFAAAGVTACAASSDYYVGHGDVPSDNVWGNAKWYLCGSGQRLTGRWKGTDARTTPGGSINVSYVAPGHFEGSYVTDDGKRSPWSSSWGGGSGFTGHFTGDGAQDGAVDNETDNDDATRPETGDSPPTTRFGIGMVPSLNAVDAVERAMHEFVGAFKEVKRIYNPPTADALFNIVRLQARLGRRADYLVIGGHGSAESPHISLSRGGVFRDTVNLPQLLAVRQKLGRAQRLGRKLTPNQTKELNHARARIPFLQSVSNGMNAGAEVVLVNCSPAATPDGREFVRNLGAVLLGRRGGTIIASARDINLYQVESKAHQIKALFDTGEVPDIGDWTIWGTGQWRKISIPAGSNR